MKLLKFPEECGWHEVWPEWIPSWRTILERCPESTSGLRDTGIWMCVNAMFGECWPRVSCALIDLGAGLGCAKALNPTTICRSHGPWKNNRIRTAPRPHMKNLHGCDCTMNPLNL